MKDFSMVRLRNMLVICLSLMSSFEIRSNEILDTPYNAISILPPDMHGWFRDINKKYLEGFIKRYNPQVIVELGSWLGKSCIFMATISSNTTIIYAVDNWNSVGSPGVQKDPEASAKLPRLYQQFLSNVIHSGLTKKIIPIRMDTLSAAKTLEVSADIVYVDASHDEDAVYNDIMAWYPHLKVGGIMCGDDYDAKSVEKAVKKASVVLKAALKYEASFWYFIKS